MLNEYLYPRQCHIYRGTCIQLGYPAITVDEENIAYSSADEIFFNKDKTKLIRAHRKKAGSYAISDRVTHIGDFAFFCCSGLTGIQIPNSVTNIGESAFHECTGLTNLTIQSGRTEIGEYGFSGCTNLPAHQLNALTFGDEKRDYESFQQGYRLGYEWGKKENSQNVLIKEEKAGLMVLI